MSTWRERLAPPALRERLDQLERINAEVSVLRLLLRLESQGRDFVPYDADVLASAGTGESYGLSFLSPEHVASRWADERLAVVAHLPGALHGWQDIVVLRRR